MDIFLDESIGEDRKQKRRCVMEKKVLVPVAQGLALMLD